MTTCQKSKLNSFLNQISTSKDSPKNGFLCIIEYYISETICICDIYDQIYGCILILNVGTLFELVLKKADAIVIKLSVG